MQNDAEAHEMAVGNAASVNGSTFCGLDHEDPS
jgi:hypothetical protein